RAPRPLRSCRRVHDRRARPIPPRRGLLRDIRQARAARRRARGARFLLRDARVGHLRLIAIGYNIAGLGLTRVMSSVMRRLADRHEIHFLGIGYSGEIVRDCGLTIYPTNPKGGDAFAAFQAKRLIEEIRPALILVMHDIWMFDYY